MFSEQKNLVDAALDAGVNKFVLISTDKAVDPIGIYGASKLICEDIVLSEQNKNKGFLVVRFGNVLGSRGSILPLFKEQILNGGPVTITHPQISRFFMTKPEAASLVLKTAGVGESGNLYILDMGEPILIKDIAEQMIRFYGFEPDVEIPIIYTGIRPGEKFLEKLWRDDDKVEPYAAERVNILKNRSNQTVKTKELLDKLQNVCYLNNKHQDMFRNRHLLRNILKEYIPTVERPENEPEF